MTSSHYVPLAENEDQCDGCHMLCLKSQADFATHGGDRLCATCRTVFWTAAVLFDQRVAEEDVIIPTLVFARNAAGSEAYRDLTKREGLVDGCTALSLAKTALGTTLLDEDQAYMGLELVKVVDGVPLVRAAPFSILAEDYCGTRLLERVRVQILSRRTKPTSIRDRYLRLLEERDARWGKNLYGYLSYDFSRSYLEITIDASEGFHPLNHRQRLGAPENPLEAPAFHFPPPTIVERFCEGVLLSLRGDEWTGDIYGLDVYGKPLGKTAEKIIPAFVAWHVGPAAIGKIPAQARAGVSRILNKHLLRPCDKPELTEDGWSSDDTVWRDVEALRLRFERLNGAGRERPLPPMVL